MREEVDDPKFEREDVTIIFFFIHSLCGHLGMLVESVLISFTKCQILILTFFLKVKIGWAALIDDSLDMITVSFCDVGGD